MSTAVAQPAASGMSARPIGVFDSGIGGLSILHALQQALPGEAFVYFSDAGHAPYGERPDAFIAQRCLHITEALIRQQGIKALVVACNTATTVAIHWLRQRHPDLPIIGVEPALKPALERSASAQVAVLATDRTLSSAKYQALAARMAQAYPHARIVAVPCSGLAGAIESGDVALVDTLCARYTAQACQTAPGVDTLVLGCTHYPLALEALRRHAPTGLAFIDSAPAVARQTRMRLDAVGLLAPQPKGWPQQPARPGLQLLGSGDVHALQAQAKRHLAHLAHVGRIGEGAQAKGQAA